MVGAYANAERHTLEDKIKGKLEEGTTQAELEILHADTSRSSPASTD